jgi:hypothetical protein
MNQSISASNSGLKRDGNAVFTTWNFSKSRIRTIAVGTSHSQVFSKQFVLIQK